MTENPPPDRETDDLNLTSEDWQDLQTYVEHHSEAVFSHGLCQRCMAEHYP